MWSYTTATTVWDAPRRVKGKDRPRPVPRVSPRRTRFVRSPGTRVLPAGRDVADRDADGARSPKDKIAFPIKLNDRLTGLHSHLERGDGTPIDAYRAVVNELSAELDEHLRTLDRMLSDDLPRLNRRLAASGLPQVVVRAVRY